MRDLNNTADIEKSCNCRNRNNCPLHEKCLTSNIIYKVHLPTTMKMTRNYLKNIEQKTDPLHSKHPLENNKEMCTFQHNRKNILSLSQ